MNNISDKKSFSQKFAGVFWNPNEHRLRVLWRLSVTVAIFLVVAILFALASIPFGDLVNFKVGHLQTNVAIIITIWLASRFIDRRRFSETGIYFKKSWWMDFGFGLLLGIILMTIIFLVEQALGWVTISETYRTESPEQSFTTAIIFTALFFLSVGIAEELAFRGYLLPNLAEGLNSRLIKPNAAIMISWIFTSVIFGIGHLVNPNATLVSAINIALGGIFLGFAYVLTGSLAIPVGLHISWNFFQGNVFGFPVSGSTEWSTTFVAVEQSGPEFWTGGPFGPEGGLIGLLGFLSGMAITALWIRFRNGRLALYTQIAIPPEITSTKQSEVPSPSIRGDTGIDP